jgi:hypothetical protein
MRPVGLNTSTAIAGVGWYFFAPRTGRIAGQRWLTSTASCCGVRGRGADSIASELLRVHAPTLRQAQMRGGGVQAAFRIAEIPLSELSADVTGVEGQDQRSASGRGLLLTKLAGGRDCCTLLYGPKSTAAKQGQMRSD